MTANQSQGFYRFHDRAIHRAKDQSYLQFNRRPKWPLCLVKSIADGICGIESTSDR
jgi:hypothetical protein